MADASRFRGKIRYFRPETKAGLAVVDIPKLVATGLGGLSRKLLSAAGRNVGDEIDVELHRIDASS